VGFLDYGADDFMDSERIARLLQTNGGVRSAKRSSQGRVLGASKPQIKSERDPYHPPCNQQLADDECARRCILILTGGNRWWGVGGTGNWAPEASTHPSQGKVYSQAVEYTRLI
jgi:hypothetical protein